MKQGFMIWATADNTPRRPAFALTHETPPVQRCIGTKGAWCSDFHHQKVTRSGPCCLWIAMHMYATCLFRLLHGSRLQGAARSALGTVMALGTATMTAGSANVRRDGRGRTARLCRNDHAPTGKRNCIIFFSHLALNVTPSCSLSHHPSGIGIPTMKVMNLLATLTLMGVT